MEYIEIIANIFLIIGVIIAAIQLWLNRKVARMDFERRKKEATIAFTDSVLERLSELRKEIRDSYGSEPITYSEYCREDNEAFRTTVKKYLNIMERISVGINSGVYDLEFYSRICGMSTVVMWDRYIIL